MRFAARQAEPTTRRASMSKNQAIDLAIMAINNFIHHRYGFDAKFPGHAKDEWDKYIEVIRILKGLKDE